MRQIRISIVLFLILGCTGLKAQETITTAGGNATGSGGSASYTVGQLVYSTSTGTNGSEAKGVQQAFEISAVLGLEEANGITLQCVVSPNPVTDHLTLTVDNLKTENLTYQLFDSSGKLLENKKMDGNQTSIDASTLVSSIYFLKVKQDNKEVKTFKIIKN